MQAKSIMVFVAVLGSLLLSGCMAGSQPTIAITSPTYGETIPAEAISVSVSLTNMSPDSVGNGPGQGHFHYYLDRAPPIVQGEPAITKPGTFVSTTATTCTWENVTPGRHIVSIELVNADDTPRQPVVCDQIQVFVN